MEYKTSQIGACVKIATDTDFNIDNFKGYKIVLIGIFEDETINFSEIRNEFYKLYTGSKQAQIIDVGDFCFNDEKLTSILNEITKHNIFSIFICENEKIAANVTNEKKAVTYISPEITNDNEIVSKLYLNNKNQNEFSAIAYQTYFSEENELKKMRKSLCRLIRLGELRDDILQAEPIIRDSDLAVVNLSSVRACDGGTTTSPNGLYAEEICQLANYIGLSNKATSAAIICGGYISNSSIQLAAHTLWHIYDGIANRIVETLNSKKIKKFIVNMGSTSANLVFYKSDITNRWWIEVQNGNVKKEISCTLKDYQRACNKEIPECWLREKTKK